MELSGYLLPQVWVSQSTGHPTGQPLRAPSSELLPRMAFREMSGDQPGCALAHLIHSIPQRRLSFSSSLSWNERSLPPGRKGLARLVAACAGSPCSSHRLCSHTSMAEALCADTPSVSWSRRCQVLATPG